MHKMVEKIPDEWVNLDKTQRLDRISQQVKYCHKLTQASSSESDHIYNTGQVKGCHEQGITWLDEVFGCSGIKL